MAASATTANHARLASDMPDWPHGMSENDAEIDTRLLATP
jgi:hypothetical protein